MPVHLVHDPSRSVMFSFSSAHPKLCPASARVGGCLPAGT